MRIDRIIWLQNIVDKLAEKDDVEVEEVEEVFELLPTIKRGPKGKRKGENLYYAYGQTEDGRYLFIVFINKPGHMALVLSARDMSSKERRWFTRR